MTDHHEPSEQDPAPEPPRRQLFKPIHDRLLRSAVLVLLAGLGVVGGYLWMGRYTWGWERLAETPEQPIPFSHRHHAGELGIDCRYCHTGAETSPFAGLPSTQTCMTCHSQIWKDAPVLAALRASAASGRPIAWRRVTDLPDFVYFNHSAHVSRGVACITCHGDVDQMPKTYEAHNINMGMCLQCHRHPEVNLVPPSRVTDPFMARHWPEPGDSPISPLDPVQKARLTNCSTCHR